MKRSGEKEMKRDYWTREERGGKENRGVEETIQKEKR